MLRRFARTDQRALLHRLHLADGRIRPAQVRTEARRKHLDPFFTLKPDERRIVAQMFRDIETKAGDVIRRVCDPAWDFDEQDRIAMASLVAAQHLRVPRRIEWAKSAANVAATLVAELHASDPENFRDAQGRLGEEQLAEQQRALEDLRSGRVWVEAETEAARGMALAQLPQLALTIVNELSWAVLTAAPGTEFVLGDDPLTMFDPAPKLDGAAPGLLSSDASQTALPLSPTTCLLMAPGPPSLAKAQIDVDDVDELNLRSYAWAVSGVYASAQETLERLRKHARDRADRLATLAPRPPQQFVFEQDEKDSDQATLTRYGADGEREASTVRVSWCR